MVPWFPATLSVPYFLELSLTDPLTVDNPT